MAFRQYYNYSIIVTVLFSLKFSSGLCELSLLFIFTNQSPVLILNSLSFGQLERGAAVGNLAIRQDVEYNQNPIVLDYI
jgi:hypothetical protein